MYYDGSVFYKEIKSDKTIGPGIEVFENSFLDPLQTIKNIEVESNKNNSLIQWERAKTHQKSHGHKRTNSIFNLTEHANSGVGLCIDMHNKMHLNILGFFSFYAQKYNIEQNFFEEDFHVLRYCGGEEYKSHYDGPTGTGRFISVLTYLNDDYVGGNLEFPHFNINIKPTSGMSIMFPSNYVYGHIAHPVTSGTKYAIVTWLHDRPLNS